MQPTTTSSHAQSGTAVVVVVVVVVAVAGTAAEETPVAGHLCGDTDSMNARASKSGTAIAPVEGCAFNVVHRSRHNRITSLLSESTDSTEEAALVAEALAEEEPNFKRAQNVSS